MRYNHLTREERGKIALLYQNGKPMREIAIAIGRAPSTVNREINRNKTRKSYQSDTAMKRYQDRRKQCRRSLRLREQALTEYIHRHLLLAWSPEQISNRMRLDYPDDNRMRIAFSSIYRWLREDLLEQSALLRQKLRHYGHRHHEKRGQFHGVRELKERCRDALKRKQVGHWEVDTIISCHSQVKECLLNMVDRKSRYCLLVLLRNKVKKEVMRGFTLMLSGLPVKTITSDRGKEFACYQDAETFFNAPFYFTRPYSPWQKPSVENSNGLIRQFFPNGTDFNEVDEQSVNQAMNMLNNRPRKCLGWKTPSEVLSDCCCT